MSIFIMSDEYSEFVNALADLRHQIIPTSEIDVFHKPEQKHADMQALKIEDTLFLLNESTINTDNFSCKVVKCKNEAGKKYPENILLNFLYLNKTLFGKLSALDSSVYNFCIQNRIKMINVNQGYCRCSTSVIKENAVITADDSIEKALTENGVDVLKISSGNIKLKGFDYGFIGGASGKINNNTLAFFGNITLHPDYNKIENFCKKRHVQIEIICKNMPLTDIGGIVKVE